MFYNCLALDNYLIPYKFTKNEHFQTWLDAQLSRFTFSNPEEVKHIYQDIYDRRLVPSDMPQGAKLLILSILQ